MAKERDEKIVFYHPSVVQWSDGSVLYNLPMTILSELFNINHFIVSQDMKEVDDNGKFTYLPDFQSKSSYDAFCEFYEQN
jgi:hypothetical protein